MGSPDPERRALVRRVAALALLAVGALVTGLGLLLVIAAWTEDTAIEAHTGHANAEVVAASFNRTLVRFQTPDGADHIPQVGVLYPGGLETGQVVRVEYDTRDPELVRVAGRGVALTLLPVGSTLLGVWAVLAAALWWLRRGGPLFDRPVRVRRLKSVM